MWNELGESGLHYSWGFDPAVEIKNQNALEGLLPQGRSQTLLPVNEITKNFLVETQLLMVTLLILYSGSDSGLNMCGWILKVAISNDL